jgi:hypothetical protein
MDNDVRSVVTAESTSTHQITSVGIPSGLSLSGCDWHPSISDQQAIANVVIAKIISFMQWDTLTPNISGITLSSLVANPTVFVNDSAHDVSFSTKATDPDGTISSVTLNLSLLGGPSAVAMTKSGDNFTYTFRTAPGLGAGAKTVTATATDNAGNTKSTSTKVTVSNPPGTLTVLNIYTDAKTYPGFSETAMSSVAPKEMTTGASEGTHCFKVTFSLNNWWDDFGFVVNNWNGSFNLTGYDTIAFDIKGPSLKGVTMSFNMQAGDNSGEGVDLNGLSADSYVTMKIPLSNFSSLGLSSITSLYFGLSGLENGSGTAYVDNIKVFSGSGSLTARISRDVIVATKPGKINYVNTVGRTMNIYTTGSGTLKIFNIAGEIVNQIYVSQTQNHVWTAHTAGLYMITMENNCSQKVVLK